jgi:hypothetical protein
MASPSSPLSDEERDEARVGLQFMVWTGFFSPEEIVAELREHFEALEPSWLSQAVNEEWQKKSAAEASWPAVTDCDRLGDAFEALHQLGFIAAVCSEYTQTSALATLVEAFDAEDGFDVEPVGHCFACGQDVEAALEGAGLYLAFGDIDDDDDASVVLGRQIRDALEHAGFEVQWDFSAATRIHIPRFQWKNRFVSEPSEEG